MDNESLQNNVPAPSEEKKPDRRRTLLENIETVLVAISIAVLVFAFGFRLCTVDGTSMYSTLNDGDKLIVSNVGYTPERGDIIVFHMTGANTYNEPLVKRVIATEGEWIDINFDTWEVRVADNPEMENAIVLDEPYIYVDGPYWGSDMEFPTQVPEGHVFVMGDNRHNSADSRSAKIGFVDERRILGKVLFRLYPLQKIEN